MQLIKRTTLHFQEATSDKIYEVDLCQTGENRYVVNFRYGRRGATLKEGVKTTQAVPLAEAEKVFDKLVAEKVKKGYQDVSTPPVRETVAPKKVHTPNPAARNQAILTRLANQEPSKWPLERAIWRAGELKITAATPLLIELLGSGDALRNYCIAWALGWCGGKGAVAALIQLYSNKKTPDFVSRIAFEALLKLADAETKAGLHSEMIEQLPAELRQLASSGTPENFSNALRDYLNSSDYKRFAVLDPIYQIDNTQVRPALINILKTAPFRPNYFQRFRHIFKLAEYRLDAEVFAILAYRLEKEKAMYNSNSFYIHHSGGGYLRRQAYQNYNPATRRYETITNEIEDELKRSESRIAYSSNTRKYLLRRVWRSLKTLGELGNTEYVKMAVNILLQYSDSDAEPVRQTTIYRWDRTNWTRISFIRNWDAYAGYLTLNHILYENSPRYELKENSKAWRCREPYKPGDPEPDVREEAFPQLWEQQPAQLLRLLLESNCRPVHHFAAKALGACPQFCAKLEVTTVITLLHKPYEATVKLGFEVARHLYNPNEPNISLVLAVVNCTLDQARAEGYRWIGEGGDRFLSHNNFITALVTSSQPETRQFARQFLSSITLSDTQAKVILGQIFAELLELDATQAEKAKDIAETLLTCFASQLRTLGLSVVRDLLQHLLVEIQEFGARILLNHQTNAADLPPGLIDLLMTSPHESIRAIGIQIFGNLPDATLLNQYSFLLTLATHELPDIRNAIRPAIRRLAINHPDFAARFIADLIQILTQPEAQEGIHASIVLQLKEDLPAWMNAVTKETALQMLKAKSSATQELAGYIISANRDNWASEFETFEIVKLADNEILSVREAAREIFLHNLNRLRGNEQEMLAAVKLVECKWDDTREFGFRVFGTFFTDTDLTPSILVNLCDSVRQDVRKFGRDIVTRYFKESYGQEYLLKFSEHPSTDMQLFATNYLERYAINNPERLQELMPYFITVLSQVNRGRVAKQRIYAFLDKEAQKTEEAARAVAEIITRQSATMAIGDKAAAIETMVKIHRTYPHLNLPIQVKPVSTMGE
jgi:predicted DNA-binding WGR domain protein